MSVKRWTAGVAIAAMLAGCGGGGGSSATGGDTATGGATTPATGGTTTAGCTLADRQSWVAAQLNEWYLFPDLLASNVTPASYTTLDAYVDALVAPARAQRRDRYFTYVTSIAQENAFYSSGQSAGFGFRLSYDTTNNRVFVNESFEGASALAAGIDRGAEIVSIMTPGGATQSVASLMAAGGPQAVVNALGANTVGLRRGLEIVDASGRRWLEIGKTDYTLTPVSSRYGAKIVTDAGRQVGYVNLRTFIDTSGPALRQAFAQFRAAGVTEVVVDLRYNGGGLVSVADLFSNLLGRDRSTSEVISYTTFRASKASRNETERFAPQPESIAPTKLAFIGTGGTASASELVINSMRPYVTQLALVGSNTFGKPVGQIALDRSACDDRLRVVAFSTQNARNEGGYYDGLASVIPQTCRAADDITYPLGDPREASFARALDFLAGRGCSPIAGTTEPTASTREAGVAGKPINPLALISPDRPDTPQREVPGAF